MTRESASKMLRAEYSLLCIGNTLKHEFDSWNQQSGVAERIPSMFSLMIIRVETFFEV